MNRETIEWEMAEMERKRPGFIAAVKAHYGPSAPGDTAPLSKSVQKRIAVLKGEPDPFIAPVQAEPPEALKAAITYLTNRSLGADDAGCPSWVRRSRFWHPGVWPRELPLIAMVGIYCDESYDGHTYALAGWVSAPLGWDWFSERWPTVFDGFPVKSFHASELVNRELVSDSRYRGWTFEQEKELFTRAVDVICDEKVCGWMRPIGVSLALPADYLQSEQEDDVWFLLFVRLFFAVFNTFPAQYGIDFMFDDKPTMREHVNKFFYRARDAAERHLPGKFGALAFGKDDDTPPLQAADLFAYEWRRRISEKRTKPNKAPRPPYTRMRAARTGGALHHYNAAALAEIKRRADAGENYVQAMLDTTTTDD